MGRGGPSLRERAFRNQIHAHKLLSLRELMPPYNCPRCHSLRSLGVKEEVVNDNRVFRFWCNKCRMETRITLKGRVFTSLDAYNKLVDRSFLPE